MSEVVATLLARNEAYVPQHATRPALPTMNTIVICCLDPSIDLERQRASAHITDRLPVTGLHYDESSGRASVVFTGENT